MKDAAPSEGAAPAPPGASADAAFDAAMRAELDRRIAALAEVDESTFGTIGRGEWVLTVVVSLLLPLVLVWMYR